MNIYSKNITVVIVPFMKKLNYLTQISKKENLSFTGIYSCTIYILPNR